jgi:hypothetical protein
MQSLALDVNVVSEEGQRAEMRDEDDDLLRAAEELGIDLTGVRAPAPAVADGAVEGDEEDADVPPTEATEDSEEPSAAVGVEDVHEPEGGLEEAEDDLGVEELLAEGAEELDLVLGDGALEPDLVDEPANES